MAFTKFLVAALAVAGSAVAQTPCKGTTTIQNSGDALAIGTCSIYQGDVIIASQAAGTISLDGIQRITGSLSCDGAVNLTSLEANDLTEIDKSFSLNGLTILSTLQMPSLTQVNNINWIALPALQQLSFTHGVTKAGNVTISNTQLNTLDGINLETCEIFNVNNNPYLTDINMQMANITQALNIQANSHNLIASFPNLEFAFNMTFRNCSEINLPSLASVNGSLGFYSNYMKTFSAANLTQTGQSLVFDDNPSLTNISIPLLKQINGGYQIANNTELKVINGFKGLKVVAGAVDFSGNFTEVSLPALTDVRGGFNMQSSGSLDCSAFNTDHSSGVIKGTYVCSGQVVQPGTAGSTPTTTSGSGSQPTKKGAAGRFEANIPAMVGVVSVIAGLLHLTL